MAATPQKAWFRFAVGAGRNAKIHQATGENGSDAVALWAAILALHSQHGEIDGEAWLAAGRPPRAPTWIPAPRAQPRVVALENPAFRLSESRIEEILPTLERAELCEVDGDGAIWIVGWDESWWSICSTCREPNPDPVRRTCPKCLHGKRSAKSAERPQQRAERPRKLRNATLPCTPPQRERRGEERPQDSADVPQDLRNATLTDSADRRAADVQSACLPAAEPDPDPESRDPAREPLAAALESAGFGSARTRAALAEQLAAKGVAVHELERLFADCSNAREPSRLFAARITRGDEWRAEIAALAARADEPMPNGADRAVEAPALRKAAGMVIHDGWDPHAAAEAFGLDPRDVAEEVRARIADDPSLAPREAKAPKRIARRRQNA